MKIPKGFDFLVETFYWPFRKFVSKNVYMPFFLKRKKDVRNIAYHNMISPNMKKKTQNIIDDEEKNIRIVCISDTHEQHSDIVNMIPNGDILVHSGDILFQDRENKKFNQLKRFNDDFLSKLPHKIKIIIGGNHDASLDFNEKKHLQKNIFTNGLYLENDFLYLPLSNFDTKKHKKVQNNDEIDYKLFDHHQIENIEKHLYNLEGITFFGSPYSEKGISNNTAFQYKELKDKYSTIPHNLDVLITHEMPFDFNSSNNGSKDLLNKVNEVNPLIHIFGHEHHCYGHEYNDNKGLLSVNAAILSRIYFPTNTPIIIDINVDKLKNVKNEKKKR